MKGRPTNIFSEKVTTPPPVDKLPSRRDRFLALPSLRRSRSRSEGKPPARSLGIGTGFPKIKVEADHGGPRQGVPGWMKRGEGVNHDSSLDLGFLLASRADDDPKKRGGKLECIEIGIASPEQIRRWAERRLSTGEVVGRIKNAETVDYKRLRPQEGGLFCERIFGPIDDYSCGCVKGKRPSADISNDETLLERDSPLIPPSIPPTKGRPLKVCPKCHVEITSSSVRRKRLGFIELFSSVTHSWFWHAQTSPMTTLLGVSKKCGENLLKCNTFLFDLFDSPTGRNVGPSVSRNAIPTPDRLTPSIEEVVSPLSSYNRCYTVPYSPLVASSPVNHFLNGDEIYVLEREALVSALSEPPPGEDRPILRYCQLERPALKPNFSDLLTYHQINRLEAAQEVLRYTAGDAIRRLLGRLDLPLLKKHLRTSLERVDELLEENLSQRRKSKIQKRRRRLIRRIKLTRSFLTSNRRPEWMVLSTLPVLPPALRPIIRTADGIIVSSDLNTLYRKIMFANKGLEKLPILQINMLCLSKRTLQEAVDALIDNGKGGNKVVSIIIRASR